MTKDEAPVYLTTREAAEYLRMPDWSLRANYRKWGLTPAKAGKNLRFRQDELVAWLEATRAA
ncbi:MAG: helix-turn-helix domain-containing protein [Streptosporangiaceae bacterium]